MNFKFFHKKNTTQLLPVVVVFFMTISILTPSCVEEPQLSKRGFNRLVDTLYTAEVSVLNTELDSLCDMQTEELIQHNVDSIMKIRLEQIEKLIQNQ